MKLIINIPDEVYASAKNGELNEIQSMYICGSVCDGIPCKKRPQGEWEDIGYGLHRCNKCGLEVKIPTNYCSFCGDHKQKDGAE